MDLFDVNCIYMLIPKETIKCTLCETYEVYNLLRHNRMGEIYAGKHTSCSNNYIHLTRIHDKIRRIPTYISYNSVQFNECKTIRFSFDLIHMCPNILHKILPYDHNIYLHHRTDLHTKIPSHTHIHKS